MAQRTSAMNQLTRPKTVQHAHPTLLPTPLDLESICDGGTNKPVKTPFKNSINFPVVVQTSTEEGRNENSNTINLARPLWLTAANIDVTDMANPI